jgi:hypothetical protein
MAAISKSLHSHKPGVIVISQYLCQVRQGQMAA